MVACREDGLTIRRGPGCVVTGMRLGFAVKVLGIGPDGPLPSHDARRHASAPHLRVSLTRLEAILAYCEHHDLRFYRMATALAPYASHPDLPGFRDQPRECAVELAAVGARARALGVRLTTHPGQYTVLNSERPEVRRLAAAELEVQAEVMDGMGLGPESVVVLHVGGAAGGRPAALDRFERGFALLSEAARRRLVVENDDRSFGLGAVLELSARIARPVVWDIHHHRCLDPDGIPDAEALRLALATWPARVTPKVHFSSPRSVLEERAGAVRLPPLRAHADLVDTAAFEHYLLHVAAGARDHDVMLEAKGKDLAVSRLRETLRVPLPGT